MNDDLLQKRVLGRYRVVRSLAVGGMGVIYLGRSEGAAGFAKPVVIKRIVPDYQALDADAEAYFVREAQILSQLRHPGIVGVIDFGEEDGAYVMVLEYVHGFHLGHWLRYHKLRNERFPVDACIHVVCRVLEALQYAHNLKGPDGKTMRVIHRDVTPSNILVDIEGHVKLADFGIAHVARGEEDKTSSGMVRGKMPYLAPELVYGNPATVSSDVYSAAVVLHELLVGENEFKTGAPASTIRKVVEHIPTRVSTVRDDVSPGLDRVLERALAKDAQSRYPSAEALLEDLRALQRMPEKDVERRLQQKVRLDFQGDMAQLLGLEPLSALDDAWRTAPRTDPPTALHAPLGRPPLAGSDPTPTTPEAPLGRVTRTKVVLASAAAVLTTLGLAGGLWAATQARKPRNDGPRYIVVERNEEPVAMPADPPPAAPEPPTAADPGAGSPTASPAPNANGTSAPTERPMSNEERLSRTFAARRGAIRACFQSQALDLAGAPSIEIRFRIGADGAVQSAALTPPSLMGTPLGHCIVGVARGIDFGRQAGPLSFTIPLTASYRR